MSPDYLEPEGVGPPTDPFTHVIVCGDTVYVAGQISLDEENNLVGIGDPGAQAEQCWTNIERCVQSAGCEVKDIVKMTIFMVDIKNNTEVWRARREFFTGDFPASTLVEVRSLAGPETLVEIEAVAYLGKS